MQKINISFIMYGGLSYGGAHKQAIELANKLNKKIFNVNYFWCEHNKDLYSDFTFPQLNKKNIQYLLNNKVNPIEFRVGYRDISKPFHPWYNTNFFEIFNKYQTDLIFSVRAGYAEYPFIHLNLPVVEWNVFGSYDPNKNIVYSVAVSPWVQKKYIKNGGQQEKSGTCFFGITEYNSANNFREELNINNDVIVLGFHQRKDDNLFSPHALIAYKNLQNKINKKMTFIILGGSEKYKDLTKKLDLKIIFLPLTFEYEYISKFLNTLNIYTHNTALGESLGIAIQEAMMHKLPIVSMRGINNGHLDVIEDTYPIAKNIDEYEKNLLDLIVNDSLRKKIAKKSWDHARLNFSETNMINYFENIFIQLYKKYKNNNFPILDKNVHSHIKIKTMIIRIISKSPYLNKKLRNCYRIIKNYIKT